MRLKRIICLTTLLCLLATAIPTVQASAKYYITVDITNQIVTVYKNGNTSESGIVRQMICSTGKSATPTPTGTYSLPSKRNSSERREWYYFPKYNCYAKWATRIVGGILFHSVLFSASKHGPTSSSVNALGGKASHGCVRLRVDDAKWVAQNCPAGTKCRVYKSGKTNSSLRKRLLKKSFSVGRETYAHFLGKSSDSDSTKISLSKGSNGAKVTQLQKRLNALGFLSGSADGKFGPETQTAVKRFQGAAGKSKTGKVNDSLWNAIFATDAPTGTYVTLSSGKSGPAVKALQQALADLKLYSGEANGSYNSDTVQAVKDFQDFFGYAVTGKANTTLQKDIFKQAADVKSRYGSGDYRLVKGDKTVSMAKLTKAAQMFAKAKTSAKKLVKLKAKTKVEVLSRTGSWSKVRYDHKTGYIQNKFLSFFQGTKTEASYEAVEATPTPTTPPTPEVFIPSPTAEVYIPTDDTQA